jgi:hypothetical protein
MSNRKSDGGLLNKVWTSMVVVDYPELSVFSSDMGEEQITLTYEEQLTKMLNNATSRTAAPSVIIPVTIEVHIVKTNNISALYENLTDNLAKIGRVVLTSDAMNEQKQTVINCWVQSIGNRKFNATESSRVITIGGIIEKNNALFNF